MLDDLIFVIMVDALSTSEHEDLGRRERHKKKAASGDRNNATTRSQSPRRAVNNMALAAMLRESACIVERGEFDPILYQALQDFRAYYKQHYPKKISEDPQSRRRRKKSEPPSFSIFHPIGSDLLVS